MKKMLNVGKNIANIRKEKNITAEQLASALGVTRQTISKWENTETVPDAYQMAKIATFLDTPIANIYVQTFVNEKHNDNPIMDNETFINFFDPKNIKKAIIAYDENPNKLKIKIGANVISYRDILLLVANMRFFRGYSELENPVSYQEMKNEQNVMPAFVQLLKNEGFIAFYANSEFACDESIIGSEYTAANEGSSILVILRNEKEVLDFKTSTRRFITGLENIDCNREWGNPSGMKYMLGASYYDTDIYKAEEYLSSADHVFTDSEKEKYRTMLNKIWEDEVENCNPIQYIKNDKELDDIKKQLESLGEDMREEFVHACLGDKIESIVILDLETRRFEPLFKTQQPNSEQEQLPQ